MNILLQRKRCNRLYFKCVVFFNSQTSQKSNLSKTLHRLMKFAVPNPIERLVVRCFQIKLEFRSAVLLFLVLCNQFNKYHIFGVLRCTWL